jgi:hypothetical protein
MALKDRVSALTRKGRTVAFDPASGRRWVGGSLSTDEYFAQARKAARAEARAELNETLARGSR